MTIIESPAIKNSYRVAPNSLVARTFLSFLATAGLFYANIMPAIVDGLIQALGFSSQDAGFVGSANVYGAAAGALLIVFLIKRLRWRATAYVLIGGLISMDLLSMLVTSPPPLIAIRFIHGVIGGALVGTAFSIIARTSKPDRTFGVLLVVQFGLGGLGNLYLPRLVPTLGVNVLFLSLIAFSVVTALMISFLDEYRVQLSASAQHGGTNDKIKVLPLALTLLAIFLFQAANMGLFAFVIGLGRFYTLGIDFITLTLAASAWVGIAGAVAVIALHTRFGRLRPLVAAMLLTVIGILVLHYSANTTIFFVANCGMGVTWAFTIPYLLGLCAEFDKSGQMAALGGFASKMGLASGPLAAGLLLGEENYGMLINISAFVLFASMLASIIPAIVQDKAPANRESIQAT